MFADTVDFIAFAGTRLTGKCDVVNVHQDLFDTWFRGSRLTGTPDIRPLSPNIALVIVSGGTIVRGKSTPTPEREYSYRD